METRLRSVLPKSTAILVDCETNKKDAIQRYGIDEKRVHVQPFLPGESIQRTASVVDIKKRFSLNNDYIYYPAQLWAHKNHYYVLEGLRTLKEKYGICVDAVFSGSDKGNLSYILESAKKIGIYEQVHYIGFVENKLIYDLYTQALALVMPTFLGPTNIPPLEAFELGCPVLYSDIAGVRDQVEGAALFMDLKDPYSMARQLLKVIQKDKEVEQLKIKGKEILARRTKEDCWSTLKTIFDEYAILQKSWKA
jgi:glycosyltransferase involved in cell wall biosynthesis